MTPKEVEDAADQAISEATQSVAEAEQEANANTFVDTVSRGAIGIVVILVWGAAIMVFGGWILFKSPEFVCSLPGTATDAAYKGTCENGWGKAIEQATDIVALFVLPVVTLVLGYYFGQLTADAKDE